MAVLQGDEPLVDAELGRVVQPWKASQVEPVRDALLRYGADRIDKVIAQVRQQGAHSTDSSMRMHA